MIHLLTFMIRTLALLVSITLLTNQAKAWWDGGHKMIALIAYEHLTPEERSWVMKRLDAHPTRSELFDLPMQEELGNEVPKETRTQWFFAQNSIWCDLIRSREGFPNAATINRTYHHSGWHYTDIAVFPNESAKAALAEFDVAPPMDWQPGMAEPAEGFNSVQTVKRVSHELADPTRSLADQAIALSWLFHLSGDFHQPCHCAALHIPGSMPDGDRGGNRIWIFGLKHQNVGLQSDALHLFWDSIWNGEKNDLAAIQQRLKTLEEDHALFSAAENSASNINPEDWLREGHALAVSHVYSPTLLEYLGNETPLPSPSGSKYKEPLLVVKMPTEPFQKYVSDSKQASRRQIALAGLRLAATIKSVIAASK